MLLSLCLWHFRVSGIKLTQWNVYDGPWNCEDCRNLCFMYSTRMKTPIVIYQFCLIIRFCWLGIHYSWAVFWGICLFLTHEPAFHARMISPCIKRNWPEGELFSQHVTMFRLSGTGFWVVKTCVTEKHTWALRDLRKDWLLLFFLCRTSTSSMRNSLEKIKEK